MDYSVKRIFRRIVVALVYVLLFGGLTLLINSLRTPAAPSCFDGIKNQDERGVDCGGACKSCEQIKNVTVFETKVFPTKPGFVDLFAEVRNDNIDYGIAEIRYTFEIFDRDGESVGTKNGITYILPNSTKFVIEQAVPVVRGPSRAEFHHFPAQFQEVKNYVKPNLTAIGTISKMVQLDEGGGVLAVEGKAGNQTNRDFDRVVVAIRLQNERGETVAVNRHEVRTLLSGEYRFYQVRWAYRVPHFTKIDSIVDTNIFEESNSLNFTTE